MVSLVKKIAHYGTDVLVSALPFLYPVKELFETGTDLAIDMIYNNINGTDVTNSNNLIESSNNSVNVPL